MGRADFHALRDPGTIAGAAARRRRETLSSTDQPSFDDEDFQTTYTDAAISTSISSSRFHGPTANELCDKLTWAITRDTEVRDLLALGLQIAGPQELERDLRGVLTIYATDLRRLSDTSLKTRVSSLFQKYCWRAAGNIVLQAQEGFTSSQHDIRQIAKLIKPRYTTDFDDSDDSDNDDSEVNLDDPRFAFVQSLVKFLSSDPPLSKLKANLQGFVSSFPDQGSTEANSTEINSDHINETFITIGAWISLRRGCISLITLGSTFILLSVFLGVYFTVNKSYGYSMGDSFTLAGYVFAIGTMIVAALMGYHYPRCKCWRRETVESIALLSRGAGRDSV